MIRPETHYFCWIGQQAPRILQPQCWTTTDTWSHAQLLRGYWGSELGPCVCSASTLLTGAISAPSSPLPCVSTPLKEDSVGSQPSKHKTPPESLQEVGPGTLLSSRVAAGVSRVLGLHSSHCKETKQMISNVCRKQCKVRGHRATLELGQPGQASSPLCPVLLVCILEQ